MRERDRALVMGPVSWESPPLWPSSLLLRVMHKLFGVFETRGGSSAHAFRAPPKKRLCAGIPRLRGKIIARSATSKGVAAMPRGASLGQK